MHVNFALKAIENIDFYKIGQIKDIPFPLCCLLMYFTRAKHIKNIQMLVQLCTFLKKNR